MFSGTGDQRTAKIKEFIVRCSNIPMFADQPRLVRKNDQMRMRDTLARLAAHRPAGGRPAASAGRLVEVAATGSNPGALSARMHVPADLPPGSPLVVVLHGCTQTASGYDVGTGWSDLADQAGFVVLFPEQRRENNANLCFNWFQPGDIARRGGEAESIAQMVDAMVERHALDRERVFVTGLSAGGAMAAVMLATYPDIFAGGAIIGGLPYGCANGVGRALKRMAGRGRSDPATAVRAAERASGLTSGRWPTVSIWHGTADATVVAGNMDDLAAQWCGVHGIDANSVDTARGANWERRLWMAGDRAVVETWRIAGMGHGVPLDPTGPAGLGAAGPYMLPVGIDSTSEIARSWGLLSLSERVARPSITQIAPPCTAAPVLTTAPGSRGSAIDVQAVIEGALRSAGLMR